MKNENILRHIARTAFASTIKKELLLPKKTDVRAEDVDIKDCIFYSECHWSGDDIVVIGKFYHFFAVTGSIVEITKFQNTETFPNWNQVKKYSRYVPEKVSRHSSGELSAV